MKIRFLLILGLAVAFTIGCKKDNTTIEVTDFEQNISFKSGVEEPCYEETYVIYGGKTIEVGVLTVSNDEENIFVTYDLTGTNWYLAETHLFVGHVDDLPLNRPGNPVIGSFPFASNHDEEQLFTYTLSRTDFDDCFAVAAHAVVEQLDENGNKISEETAFADGGTQFPGKRWGWYLAEYCVEECEDPKEPCVGAFIHFSATTYPNVSNCFTNYGFDTYGWTNGPIDAAALLALPGTSCMHSDLIFCPDNCSVTEESIVGAVSIEALSLYEGLDIIFESLKPGYTLKETYLYVGAEPFPIVNGNYSINPEDFTYSHLNLNGATTDRYKFATSGEVYIILYAVFEEN